jgi:hypothetical protein
MRPAPRHRHHDLEHAGIDRKLRSADRRLLIGPKAKKPAEAGFQFAKRRDLQRLDIRRLQPLGALLHFELDLLAFLEGLEAAHLDRGVMREKVLTALSRGDEAEAFRVVEPLDGTSCHVHLLPLDAATIPGATKPGMTIKEVI